MNDDNEIEMVWVEFVGGPLDGQCRNLERGRTTFEAYSVDPVFVPYSSENAFLPTEKTQTYTTYKIVRSRLGNRESFKGVLV